MKAVREENTTSSKKGPFFPVIQFDEVFVNLGVCIIGKMIIYPTLILVPRKIGR